MSANAERDRIVRQRCFVGQALSAALVAGAMIAFLGLVGGLRLNLTPSAALGLWRIAPLELPVTIGQSVFVCLPNGPAMQVARERGYLRAGLCSGGHAPLIKRVVAISGQRVVISDHLWVDGVRIQALHLLNHDAKGRPLLHDTGGIVPAGMVYLFSPYPGSWDSRYFGPVPASGILGLAQEIWTYAP
ncbi:conjugation peptidase TraF. Serine peptidase. MEROPS family S26C [Rhizobium sp. RU33A]|uniref:conjugative transfer signal peptidase TraF n=1 Tax=Rhizobium sp. RU33A TaxID=1907413 RepID=UPI000953B697|nr:conjugative transfer signal peptidase TraF [Rhizobium sp. RU33A]SIQ89352.1 conjugation peptidase TraF. Serine peptidase. MEROPS family S26C [Rhizobium sp. RU33A]